MIPHSATCRAIVVQYPIKSTEELCDTESPSIAQLNMKGIAAGPLSLCVLVPEIMIS